MSVEEMTLELVDGTNGYPHGEMTVFVEYRPDGTGTLIGELRFEVIGFVEDATWTLRYAWQDRTKPVVAFKLAQVTRAEPGSVVLIKSVEFDKGTITKEKPTDVTT